MHGGVRGELCKENVLRAGNGDAVYQQCAAKLGLPEGHIKNMVKAKGNKSAFDHTVYPGSGIA